MSIDLTRREFLRNGSVIAVGMTAPAWLASVAQADMFQQAKGFAVDPNNVLVVCQLTGGNDGLNTIVPFRDPAYYAARPTLAIPADQVLKLNEWAGLHPRLGGLERLFRKGQVALVQNVGYPSPNRSHFKSMDIWQSASLDGSLRYGWIGRHFDRSLERGALNPVVGLGLSKEKPRALGAEDASIPCFASLADIQNMLGDPDAERRLRLIQGNESTGDTRLIQQANKTALDAMVELRDRLTSLQQTQAYANDGFGQGFKQLAQIIAVSPATRVLYFSHDGFDTHAQQADKHANLLGGFGDAVEAFMTEMEARGKAKNVLVMVFSEFGRRVRENGSGTDHGAAGPMMLIGGQVKGGFYGRQPDLVNLENQDLKFETDFRQVYATALDRWLGGDSVRVLGAKYAHVAALK